MGGEFDKICYENAQGILPFPKMKEDSDEKHIDNVSEKEKCILNKSDDPMEDISNRFSKSMNIIERPSPNIQTNDTSVRLVIKFGKYVPSRITIKKQGHSNSTFGDSKRSEVLVEALQQKSRNIRRKAELLGNKFQELCQSGIVTEAVRRSFFDEAITRLRERCNEIHRLESIVKASKHVTSEPTKNRRAITVVPMRNRRAVTVEPIEYSRSITIESMENQRRLNTEPMEDIVHQFKNKVNIGASGDWNTLEDDHKKMIEECRKTIKDQSKLNGLSFIAARAKTQLIQLKESDNNLQEGAQFNCKFRKPFEKGATDKCVVRRLQFLARCEKRNAILQKYHEFRARFLKRLSENTL